MQKHHSVDDIPPDVVPNQKPQPALDKEKAQNHRSKQHHVTFLDPKYAARPGGSVSSASSETYKPPSTAPGNGERHRHRAYDVKSNKPRVCGLERNIFWAILAVALICILVGFGCGVSAGMKLRSRGRAA